MTDDTAAVAADGQARPADTIPVESKEAQAIETAATKNAAAEAEATKAQGREPEQPATETTQQPEPAPTVKKLPDWAEKRISEEAYQRREALRQAKAAAEEAARLREQLARLQAPAEQTTQQVPVTPPAGQIVIDPADYDRAIQAEADKRAALAQFNADCNKVHAEGAAAYADFDDALKNLGALGALNEQTLQTIIATGEGPRLLYELGSNPDEAAKVLSLPQGRLAIELGKRAATKPAKAAAPVSNAPAPIKPLDGSARISAEPLDSDDDAAWFAKRREQRRAARGR